MSEETGAGEALEAAAADALDEIEWLAIYRAPPVQAVVPYATVEVGPESDWSHKGGTGRELRLAVTLRDKGERPIRLGRMAADAEALVGAISAAGPNWQLVTLQFLRSRLLSPRAGSPDGLWSAVVEFRARMLAL
jgi:hypothetical protein